MCCVHTGPDTLTLHNTPENLHYTYDHVVSAAIGAATMKHVAYGNLLHSSWQCIN
jgi:hypothetical protein